MDFMASSTPAFEENAEKEESTRTKAMKFFMVNSVGFFRTLPNL